MEEKKVVCLISGGPDSVIAAMTLRSQGYSVIGLNVNYGQKARERLAARALAKELNFPLIELDLDELGKVLKSALTTPDMAISDTFTAPIIVPVRNAILLSVAAGVALSLGANVVAYGAHLGDARNYPDCRKDFVTKLEEALTSGAGTEVKVLAPNIEIPKSAVLECGVVLGVPLHLTWSCYADDGVQCGICESCRNRREAFIAAGINDRTAYKNPLARPRMQRAE